VIAFNIQIKIDFVALLSLTPEQQTAVWNGLNQISIALSNSETTA
jgi:hypothetical protein